MNTSKIKEHMPVVSSEGGQFATVDRIEGNSIKLTRDAQGQHHYIPTSWVTSVDQSVHIDRPLERATREWSNQAPAGARA